MEKKILVVGATGQLGSAIMLNQHSFQLIGVNHEQFDLLNVELMRSVLSIEKPDLIINCAAFTNVELAEEEEDVAVAINANAVENLAELCNEFVVPMIHISTDYVFDGMKNGEYLESDKPSPLNVYGASKLLGEELALKKSKLVYVIRVSWLYAQKFNNFKNTILELSKTLDQLKVVADQVASPTFAGKFAEDLIHIAKVIFEEAPKNGIYHYSHEGKASWYDFAKEIKEVYKFNTPIAEVDSEYFETKAKRPSFSKLNNNKIKSVFKLKEIHWKQALKACFEQEKRTK
ncbi:MAG: dTDP-4-dehydrorhamnose reductase [Flavobacteriales bacterium]